MQSLFRVLVHVGEIRFDIRQAKVDDSRLMTCGSAAWPNVSHLAKQRKIDAELPRQVPSRPKRKALASIQPQAQPKKKKSSQRCQPSKENKSTPQRKRVNKKIQKENKAPASNQGHKQGHTSTGKSRRVTQRQKRTSNSQSNTQMHKHA